MYILNYIYNLNYIQYIFKNKLYICFKRHQKDKGRHFGYRILKGEK